MYKLWLFDLDGTVTQSEFGITRSVIHALSLLGINETKENVMRFIGPPLYDSFTKFYGLSDKDAKLGVKYYREYYTKNGIFDAPLFDGIMDVLKTSHENDKKIVLCTSKPVNMAEMIAKHFDFYKYLNGIYGPSEKDISPTKDIYIKRALADFDDIDEKSAIMIGDTKYDMDAAFETGVFSVGVTYGYGSKEELINHKASVLVDSPSEILKFM